MYQKGLAQLVSTLLTSRACLLDSLCALDANRAVYGDRAAREVCVVSRRVVLGNALLVGGIAGVDDLLTRRADVGVVSGVVDRERR